MTQDDIVAMAKEAGAAIGKPTPTAPEIIFTQSLDIRLFAKLVAEKATEEANTRANVSWKLMCEKMVAFEREACAKVCDELSDKHTWEGSYADECATAIRARGQQ